MPGLRPDLPARLGQQQGHGGRVDVAAAQDHPDPAAKRSTAPLSRAATPSAPDGSTTSLRPLEQKVHGIDDRGFADRPHVVDVFQHQGEGHRPQAGRARSVGDSGRVVDGLQAFWYGNERVASSASSGSMPITRQDGHRPLAAMAEPLKQPPAPARHQQRNPAAPRPRTVPGRRSPARRRCSYGHTAVRACSPAPLPGFRRSGGDPAWRDRRAHDPRPIPFRGRTFDRRGIIRHDDDRLAPRSWQARATAWAWLPDE